MSNSSVRTALLCALLAAPAAALDLRILSEFDRPDPFGSLVAADRAAPPAPPVFTVARRGYLSAHIVAVVDQPTPYTLSLTSPLPAELHREWFHRHATDHHYYPDALIPVTLPYRSRLPEPDNAVPNQTAQAFWLDLWIPAETAPGPYTVQFTLTAGAQTRTASLAFRVLPATVPDEDAITLDHNSYGTSWLLAQYPRTLAAGREEALYPLIHAHHRLFYEHRGTYHQLGYGHGGKVGPEFAPELAGTGRNKRIVSWDRFDRHYGPLLDGSAFAQTRRGARPIPWVYLPINPEWPADFLWWGEPGYAAEFTGVVGAMERHFREKGWTKTTFELFFNHKKRYKAFSWDGDELRFERDNEWLIAYRRLFDQSIPADSPVHFRFRADSSWTMNQQFQRLAGVVNFWIAGEGMLTWYPDWPARLRARGDVLWTYGGTPPVDRPSAAITFHPFRTWLTGSQGFVRWQTVEPGPEPWTALAGGGETLVYPGDRFGLATPLPSLRLKLQRNCLQDLALLAQLPRERHLPELLRLFNQTTPADWRNTAPPLAARPVLEWDNVNLDEAQRPFEQRISGLDAHSWQRVRAYLHSLP